MDAVSGVRFAARRGARSSVLSGLARFGYAARGIVYLLVGWLALQIAMGHRSEQANQRGAMAEVVHHRLGSAIVVVLAFGLAAYAIWRLSEAAFGVAGEGKRTGPRLQSLCRGVIYGALAISTFRFVAGGSNQSQDKQQADATARLMKHSYGQWLVAIVGIIVIIVGIVLIRDGLRRKFKRQLRLDELTGRTQTFVVALGTVGTVCRGIVFAVAGILVVDAAWSFDPNKSKGLDGALRTLANQPFGPWLLGALSIGLLAFGLFSLSMARYAKTTPR